MLELFLDNFCFKVTEVLNVQLFFFFFALCGTCLDVMANYCLLVRIHSINCPSSEKELVFGLDKPKVCKHNHPGTLGLI